MPEPFCKFVFRSERTQAIFAMLIGSMLISLGPFFVEFSTVSAETNTFYRLLVGSVFFFFYSYVKKEFKMDPKFLTICILAGGLLVLDLLLWNQSVLYIGAGLSTVLSNIEIVFLILIGRAFFKERAPANASLLLGFITIAIYSLLYPVLPSITWKSALGITLALSASLSYALYIFSIKYISQKFPKHTSIGLLSIACLTGCFLMGIFILSKDINMFCLPSWHSAIYIFTNSILSQVAGWWFISKGISRLSLSLSGLLLLLQPAITFSLDCFFLKRNTHWLQIIGCLCLLASVYIATKNQQKESNDPSLPNSGQTAKSL